MAPVLSHYDPERETMLETDASDGVLAGVLSQQDNEWDMAPCLVLLKDYGASRAKLRDPRQRDASHRPIS